MFKLTSSIKSIGLEKTSQSLKFAEIKYRLGAPVIKKLETIALSSDLKGRQFGKRQPFLITGVEGYEVLLRSLYLPVVKEKDIEEALVFQAEPLLPYPVDQAVLVKQTVNQSTEGTSLLLISLKKETLQSHLDQWEQLGIEPEKVACLQVALCQFAKNYLAADKLMIVIHIQDISMTAVLINGGKLVASFSQQEGLNLLRAAVIKDLSLTSEQEVNQNFGELDFSALSEEGYPHLKEATIRLKRTVAKMYFALLKEAKGMNVEGLILTGDGAQLKGFSDYLFTDLPPSTIVDQNENLVGKFSFKDLLTYAMPIGLALNLAPSQKEPIDFRKNEHAYSKPLKRVIGPLLFYFLGILVLSGLLYYLGQELLKKEETVIKQNYVDLLANLGKTYDQFESSYLAKNLDEDTSKVPIEELDREKLYNRLAFIQKDLQSVPDTFPLFANVPRVSDVLAWLSTHPAIAEGEKKDGSETKLFLENFSYTLIKRPEQGKKQEKYQVKVDLEFSTSVPKYAREFHDALIAPNDFIDPKTEIKWNANRNNYKTSFYLKDKTAYL